MITEVRARNKKLLEKYQEQEAKMVQSTDEQISSVIEKEKDKTLKIKQVLEKKVEKYKEKVKGYK